VIDFGFLWQAFVRLIAGLPITLELAATAILVGTVLATALAIVAHLRVPVASQCVAFFVFCIRGSPLLLQMFIIYYGLGQFRHELQSWGVWPFFREPYWCAITALVLSVGAYGSEIIRGGLKSVSAGLIEAARACGMSGFLLYRRIILPIAFRQALPAYGNEVILAVKATSLASTITIMEVTGIAAELISQTFRAFEVFIVAGAIYLTLNFIITRLIALLEYRLSPHQRDLPVKTNIEARP
jgi:octopine/nopaline transport system permease protein